MTPVSLSFGDGSTGECQLTNKRGDWSAEIPSTVSIRRSDDSLKYQCKTEDGREAVGSIPSTVGAKIIASAVFIDFGITDAITDKHREYPASFVVPVKARTGNGERSGSSAGNEESAADPFDFSVGGEEDVEGSSAESDEVDPLDMQQ
jgi:hypothetical protein